MTDLQARPPIPVQFGTLLHALDSELPPSQHPADTVSLLCGRRLPRAAADIRKRWTPSGWCDRCFLHWLNALRPAAAGTREVRRGYEVLGWPVTLRGRDVSISLRACSVVA